MTVKELIKKLECYDDSADVLVEVNHDLLVTLNDNAVETEFVRFDNSTVKAFEEDRDTKSIVVIRAI
jgi:phage regulator Rha-like protein